MAPLIYTMCALTSGACWLTLWRGWRAGGGRLLFWSAWCFALLTLNNVLLVVDKILLPVEVDLRLARLAAGLAAILLLLFGMVWEED